MTFKEKNTFKEVLGPSTLAAAIVNVLVEYTESLKSGEKTYPAYKRRDINFVELWQDMRIEALHNLFNFGASDHFILIDMGKQENLYSLLLENGREFLDDQYRGEKMFDTVGAIYRVYRYLDEVGGVISDRETCKDVLSPQGKSIFDRFFNECRQAKMEWATYSENVNSQKRPPLLLELLYKDVTLKTKYMALTVKFGYQYEDSMRRIETRLKNSGHDIGNFFRILMEADDPDHLNVQSQF